VGHPADDPESFADLGGHVEWAPFLGNGSIGNIGFAIGSGAGPSELSQGLAFFSQVTTHWVVSGGVLYTAEEFAVLQAQNTTQTQTQQKPGEEHKGEPYSLKPEGSTPAGNGAEYHTYQVVDPTGRSVKDVTVQEHIKVVAVENATPPTVFLPVYYKTGEVVDRVGPLGSFVCVHHPNRAKENGG